MKFVDSCILKVVAGTGGNGSVAFRREKFVPFGGPAGGDGGRGGDIVFVVDGGRSTLLDLAHARVLRAKHGQHGMGKDCYGKGGESLEVLVPAGTQVFDRHSGELLFDLAENGQRVVVAQGGRGGRGNIHFASAEDRAPKRAELGMAGEERELRLDLKVMADVGLLGFPNVGKSTCVAAVSRAHPKIAEYPFTTLVPHLGVVRIDDQTAFVIADIPGLIPGASQGAGLGIRFLKHVERTRALLHLITVTEEEAGRDPVVDYGVLLEELRTFDPELAKRPTIVAMSKADLPYVRDDYPRVAREFARKGIRLRLVSAATGEGMAELMGDLARLVSGDDRVLEAPPVPAPSSRAMPAKTKKPEPAKKKGTKKVAATKTSKKTKKKVPPPPKSGKRMIAGATKKSSKKNAGKSAPKKAAPRKAVKKVAPKRPAPKKAAKKAKK